MGRWWKRLESWFWPLLLLSPFIITAYLVAEMVWIARSSGR